LRFYAGLSIDETAEILGLNARTIKRDWEFARAWLASDLESQPP
jgi:DNA-directed RNA polymerase specialized sigma24 family protein